MAEKKVIAVTSDARSVVKKVKSYDPGAPSAVDMRKTSGVEVSWVKTYPDTMKMVGEQVATQVENYFKMIRKDLDAAIASIEDLHHVDEEIARKLKALAREIPGSEAPRGGRS